MDKHGVWHHLKGCKRSNFLFPVAAMSAKFYGRFMHLITRRLKEKDVIINQEIRRQCKEKHWVVHSKPPAKGVGQVLEYIGRYAYRVAITNSRILDVSIFPSITRITEVVGSTKSPTLELTIS